jgi:molybdopterin-guanine dinucleotide biosynthesis protein A
MAAAKLASPGPTTGILSAERKGHSPLSLTVSINTPAYPSSSAVIPAWNTVQSISSVS